MDTPSDRDLILNTRRGDVEAFGELVTRHQTSVFNVCYRILHERGEAEDISQETFIRAHARLGSFDLERPFGPWILRVAVNICLNYRAVIELRHYQELSYDEIASELKTPLSHVKSHLFRARKLLAKKLSRLVFTVPLHWFRQHWGIYPEHLSKRYKGLGSFCRYKRHPQRLISADVFYITEIYRLVTGTTRSLRASRITITKAIAMTNMPGNP